MAEAQEITIDMIKNQIIQLNQTFFTDNLENSLLLDKIKNDNKEGINILIKYLSNNIEKVVKEKDIQNSYIKQLENQIIKLEKDIKYYTKKYFQFIIQSYSLEMKLKAYYLIEDEYEELKEKVKYEDGKFLENDRKDNEIIILRRENSNIKNEITKLQEHNKELQNKINNNEDEMEKLKYKIKHMNKKMKKMENDLNSKNETSFFEKKNFELFQNNINKINYFEIKSKKHSLDKNKSVNNKRILFCKNELKMSRNMRNQSQSTTNILNVDSIKKNDNMSMRTFLNNQLIFTTFNKKQNSKNKNIVSHLRNLTKRNIKKIRNELINMNSIRPEDNDKTKVMYFSGNNLNKKSINFFKNNNSMKINQSDYIGNKLSIRKYKNEQKKKYNN